VILFPGRAGSSYLVTMLAAHPQIEVKSEVLGALRKDGSSAQLEWAARFLRGPLVSRHKAFGFKTKLRDIRDADGFAEVLKNANVRVVELGRLNDVKHAVSRINARRLHEITGRWNREPGDAPLQATAITPDDLRHHLERVEIEKADIHNYVEALGLPTLALNYEDLLSNLRPTLARLFDFIDVPDIEVVGTTQKNTDDDLGRAVTNLEELREHFQGTKYASMFDERAPHESSH
jgi:LPS sulfotransferase NodH